MAVSLSDFLEIRKKQLDKEGCYDTILDLDSLMFVNFLRIKDSETPEMAGAYKEISRLFASIGKLLRASTRRYDRFWNEADKLLEMSEFEEVCLGYSQNGTSGSGSGYTLKQKILNTGREIILAGVQEPEIFELVGLFEDNIGPDRISDFIARTIKGYLKNFTIRVLQNLKINPKTYPDIEFKDGIIINPYNRKELFLLPKDLLHELPVAEEWADISTVCMINDNIRKEINRQIGKTWKDLTLSEKKGEARKLLLANRNLMRELVADYKIFHLEAYDFDGDPLGESTWYHTAKDIASQLPLDFKKTKIESIEDLKNIVREICFKFKDLIEKNGLNEILYANGKPRKERIAQRLFFGIAEAYCQANNVGISPETNSGRGAVDFKFNIGYDVRGIVEIKLTTNPQVGHGYEKQIIEYKAAEKDAYAIYLVIDNGGSPTRRTTLVSLDAERRKREVNNCDLIIIDGLIKPTASVI